MTDIRVSFIHPTNARTLDVSLDNCITVQEAIAELISADFIQPSLDGYSLAVKGGEVIEPSTSFSNASIGEGTSIRIIPNTIAGGYSGFGSSSSPTQDVTISSQSTTKIVHLYDDLQLKYEEQSRQLDYEKTRTSNTSTSVILLLVSQVVLSIGTKLLADNFVVAVPIMIAGSLQTLLAVYLAFIKGKIRD